MKRLVFSLVAMSFVLLFASCGQSGPLYLPGDPSTIQNQPPTPAEVEDEKEEESDAPEG